MMAFFISADTAPENGSLNNDCVQISMSKEFPCPDRLNFMKLPQSDHFEGK